jgi:hypothetical protein
MFRSEVESLEPTTMGDLPILPRPCGLPSAKHQPRRPEVVGKGRHHHAYVCAARPAKARCAGRGRLPSDSHSAGRLSMRKSDRRSTRLLMVRGANHE